MRKRKNKKSELESKKLIFFQLGLIIALLSVLYAFEYKSYETYELPVFDRDGIEIPSDLVPPTIHKKPLPPPPKPIVIIKVDFTDEIDDEPIEIEAGANEDTPITWEPKDEPEEIIVELDLIYIPEEMPSFPGGYKAMMTFLSQNIVYPKLAVEINTTGNVFIEFIVEKDGSISNLVVLKGIGAGCEEEAIRVIRMMPNWNPGRQNGIPVRVRLTLPVKFSLL